jgi:transcriptional regulator PpsR
VEGACIEAIEGSLQSFKSPKETIGDLDADTAAAAISAAADIALVVDSDGLILDTAISNDDLSSRIAGSERWRGRRWSETITEETQPKVQSLLREVAARPSSRLSQLHYAAVDGPDIPVLFSVARLQKRGRFVAMGRDMRGLAALQQRLVEAQISMEREFSRLRHAETRYRILFQTTAEPVLIVDAVTDRVVEVNPAATRLFGDSVGRTIGRSYPKGLDANGNQSLQSLATAIRAGLSVDDVRVRLAGTETEFTVSTTMFRQGAAAFYLMRFSYAQAGLELPAPSAANAKRLSFVNRSPDAYVVVDSDGRIITANPAFLQMIQIMNEDQARGELIERWLGRSGVDVSVLLANVRQHGSVTMFSTLVRGEYGATASVEISAAALNDGGERPSFGLAIRNTERRITHSPQAAPQLNRTVEQLKELIGRVTLKDLVRESTDVIERLCIEAALELTGDNRASAAEMLGLSRQSLYVKLRRFGLASAEIGTGSERA